MRLAAYGAPAGAVIGSALGAILTAAGSNLPGTLTRTLAGAILLALYGAVLGSIRVNDNPVSHSRVLLLAAVGAALGWVGYQRRMAPRRPNARRASETKGTAG